MGVCRGGRFFLDFVVLMCLTCKGVCCVAAFYMVYKVTQLEDWSVRF